MGLGIITENREAEEQEERKEVKPINIDNLRPEFGDIGGSDSKKQA